MQGIGKELMVTQTLLRSRKPKREDLPKDANLCEFCSAKCCKYIALPIDTPETREDFDNLRWYIMHGSGTINVFVEEDQWYLMIHQACQHLLPDNRCGVYHTRPQICRDYHTDNCEYNDDWVYDRIFESPDQVWEYAEAVLGVDLIPPKGLPILA